ncbi:MAG TPA: hypothetical protein VKA92_03305 [Segetibacter sp.]|nr:hypothetical protein [Segetibacter sp.]
MSKIFTMLLLMIAFKTGFAQVEEKTSQTGDKFPKAEAIKPQKTQFDVTVSLKNQHYWRGGPIGYSPLVTSQTSLKSATGLEVGTWNGFGFDGIFKDVDTYISFSKSGVTLALWDVYNFTNPNSGYADPATFPSEYFDYDSKTTRHFLDLSLAYDFKKIPLSLFAATIVYGRDRSMDPSKDVVGEKFVGTRSGKNRYSTYTKAAYTVKTSKADFTPYVSYGFVFNNVDESSFWGKKANGFTEVGFNVGKSIKVTDTWSMSVSAGIVASPMNNTANGLVSLTLF